MGLTINGNLTVDAPSATVNNNATVTGNITINNVSGNTWNELSSNNKLVFNAAGKTLNIGAGVKVADLTLNANGAKLEVANTATLPNTVVINAPATVISSQPITTKIGAGVVVTLKADAADAGIPVTGTGVVLPPINLSEINGIMDQLQDGMFDGEIYPGRGDNTYTLSSMVSEKVKKLSGNENIELTVSNEDTVYGYYKVTLEIAGATVSKDIKVDTVTVNSEEGFNDALTFNINKVILADSFEVEKQIIVEKQDVVIDGKGKTISAAAGMTYIDPNKSVLTVLSTEGVTIKNLTVDASNINTADKWDGIYTVQVYESDAIVLEGVTLKDGDAGLLVNGSKVTVKNITTSSNEFGGIEVSQGKEVSSSAKLTISGTSTHINENIYIWTIGENATVVDNGQYKSGDDNRADKKGYVNYILASETRPVPYTDTEPTDTTAPVVTEAKYSLNGTEVDLLDEEVGYTIRIPATDNNVLNELSIKIEEASVITVTGSSNIDTIDINSVLKGEKLDKLTPVDGFATLNLKEVAKLMSYLKFSKYAVDTEKTITLKLTDLFGNVTDIELKILVVEAPEEV